MCGVVKMKIKNVILAGVLAAGLPLAVQAQEVESYDDYQVSCESGADCNNFDVDYEQQPEANDDISQRTRTRTRTRTRRSSNKKAYVGITPGLAFLGDGTNVGIGGSLVGGYNFSEKVTAELEILDYFGGLDDGVSSFDSVVDDSGYNYFGIAANVVSKYSFNKRNPKSLYAFGGAGLGYGRFSFTGDFSDFLDDIDVDTSLSGFLINLKLGVGYPITDSIDLMGQARYVNTLLDEINSVTFQQDAITLDLGAKINF